MMQVQPQSTVRRFADVKPGSLILMPWHGFSNEGTGYAIKAATEPRLYWIPLGPKYPNGLSHACLVQEEENPPVMDLGNSFVIELSSDPQQVLFRLPRSVYVMQHTEVQKTLIIYTSRSCYLRVDSGTRPHHYSSAFVDLSEGTIHERLTSQEAIVVFSGWTLSVLSLTTEYTEVLKHIDGVPQEPRRF